MNIHIKTKDLELTPALKQWIDEKIGDLDKFIARYEEQGEILCEVEVARTSKHHHKGDVFRAEANIQLPNKLLRAEEHGPDIRAALDRVRDRLQRDLVKHKDKAGLTGKALRHVARMSKATMQRILWWRNK